MRHRNAVRAARLLRWAAIAAAKGAVGWCGAKAVVLLGEMLRQLLNL